MKKYIIIVLVVIGVFQITTNLNFNFEKEGHGIVEPVINSNSIEEIVNPEFDTMHKDLYPDDVYFAFRYTLLDDADSIEFYIGDDFVSSYSIGSNKWGEIYILIKDGKEIITKTKDMDIIDKYTVNTMTTSSTRPLESIFPLEYDYCTKEFGKNLSSGDFTINQKIPLITYIKGYTDGEPGDENEIKYIDGSISIVFKKE